VTTHKEQTFKSDFGGKAVVSREDETSQRASKENARLRDMGKRLAPEPDAKYIGSAAVHLYIKEGSALIVGSDVAMFKCQTSTMQDAAPEMANASAIQLNQQLQKMFTGRMQTRKSGF
jgi:hypothetical protein